MHALCMHALTQTGTNTPTRLLHTCARIHTHPHAPHDFCLCSLVGFGVQDVLKTKKKCLDTAEAAVRGGQSVVIDATNKDKAVRVCVMTTWCALVQLDDLCTPF